MAKGNESNYLLVAAIDFGTTFSGFAFSTRHDFEKDPTNTNIKRWIDPTSSMVYNKTSTCILFTKEKKFNSFGFEAEAKYLDLVLDNEHKNWYFFRRFKMTLYEFESIDQKIITEDEGGKSMPALVVFTESIRYLKQSLLDEVKNQQTDIQMNDIKWIVTVPAIWSDPAKMFMRRVSVEAGINSNMLTIALEPEAAALFVKHLPVEKRVAGNEKKDLETFTPGSKYIVIDAGGGTIDITAHKVMKNGYVEELIKATGGNWGGTSVDDEFMDFVKCLLGESVYNDIKKKTPNALFEACREFEMSKRAIKPNSDVKFSVRIPHVLGERYRKVNTKSTKVVTTRDKQQISVTFTGDKLRMAAIDAESFFGKSITNITGHITRLLQHKEGTGISTIILVGGYADSPMLVDGIRLAFPKMCIIIPHEAIWSVLRGAVVFGHDPSLITRRRNKYNYGIRVYETFEPSMHDEKYKYNENGEERCGSLFSKLAEHENIAIVGDYQQENRYLMESYSEDGNLPLYSSLSNPKYIDEKGCNFIGYILPSGHDFLLNETINVQMHFGEPEIIFKAYQPKSGKSATFGLGVYEK